MERVVRYGIVGCGTHAYRGHYVHGKKIPGLRLVALCDPDAEKYPTARSFTQDDAEGVSMYRDYREFLAHPDLDAVVIVSPDRFHTRQLDAAIEAGKHVLVDKPAAATMADVIQLQATLQKARERSLVVSSCHPRRFNPAYVQMKTTLPVMLERFGPVDHIAMDFSYHEPRADRADLHSGMLADHMNHEFDFMNFLFGRSDCDATRLTDQRDRYEAAGIRKDGIAFHFSGTRRLKEKVYPETIRIRFDRGEITAHTKTPLFGHSDDGMEAHCLLPNGSSVFTIYEHEAIDEKCPEGDSPSSILHLAGQETNYEVAFEAIMADFRSAIADGTPPYLTHDDIYFNSLICVELTGHKTCSINFPK